MNLSDLNKLSGVVELTERIVLTLTEEENHLECKATLVADCAKFEPKEQKTYHSPGVIEIDCAGYGLRITNLNMMLKYSSLGFVTGLVIKNASRLALVGLKIVGGSLWGCELRDCNDVNVSHSEFSNSLHGGLCLGGCHEIYVRECDFLGNGIDPPNHGYGVTLSTAESKRINRKAEISCCRAFGNLRKAIDVHCGIDVVIKGCIVNNVADGGIYAVCEGDSKFVNAVLVTACTVIQDSNTPSAFGIAVGATSESGRPTPQTGSFEVSGCTVLSRPSSESLSGIHVYMPSAGCAPDRIIIDNNAVMQTGKPGRSCGISFANAAEVPGKPKPKVKNLQVSGNVIELTGQSSCGISAGSVELISAINNTVRITGDAYAGLNLSAGEIHERNNRIEGKCNFMPKRLAGSIRSQPNARRGD